MKTTEFLSIILGTTLSLAIGTSARADNEVPTVKLDDGTTIKLNTEPAPFKSPLRTSDDDGNWFMEETTPKKPKAPKGARVPLGQPSDVGVPMTPDGRIIPLKTNGMPIMQQGSNLEITNEYVIQPGFYPGMPQGFYPGIPQWNTPYMGGLNPYFSPGVVPYNYGNGNLNFNVQARGFSLGTGGFGGMMMPYTSGSNTFSGTQFGIGPNGQTVVSPWMGPNYSIINNGFIGAPNQLVPRGY